MFQSEMENLELGLNLRSSDLLFPDDLLNLPLDGDQNTGLAESVNIFGDDVFADESDCKMEVEDNDLLAQIIEEVQLPGEFKIEDVSSEVHVQEDVTFWPVNDDISFVDSNSPTSSDSSNDDTQTLIDEMEEFLVSHENGMAKPTEEEPKTVLTQNMETEKAEAILDALITGNISLNESASSSEINNISEVQTSDGENVIIVITNDTDQIQVAPSSPAFHGFAASPSSSYGVSSCASPAPSMGTSSMASPASTMMEENNSDSDWSPSEYSPKAPSKKSREPKKRGPYKRSKQYNIKDKKERKKLQNVVAARRYRDKKKNEQVHVEEEVDVLDRKNKQLKQTVSEMEGELKTLKKLMIELGLVKIK